ncbi:MipA/OmpV family protein [Sphingomonas baiyangensis]|uniref:MipA/OmpV family protein n=1 Tax=Sphingomonas baiyangensis TaxID=2572576 RepID=A0A4U1L791_9SPHN|nr:MipA/OmpV family protein [Sphingomonas baiyangensis]TKD52819.1 MipA/OmpV family protein [Sphingomonas baiyangensis]
MILRSLVCAYVAALAVPAVAQDDARPVRTRVALGPQLVPNYPGSDGLAWRPLVDVSRARGDDAFDFEAPDESFGFPLLRRETLAIGPAIGVEGRRTRREVGVALPEVGFSFELGGFVQYEPLPALRLRAEVRKGLSGHKGLIAVAGADYVLRNADRWLFSIGPRVTLADNRYQDAYFTAAPADAAAAGIAAFDARAGINAVGLTAGFIRQLTPRWGIYSYAKYDRLAGDAGRSPVTRAFGTANQISGGIALSYTFGRGVR